jgi:hypothetical protein
MNRRFTDVSQPPAFIEDDREGGGRRRRRWPSSASAWWWPAAEAGALTRPHLVAATRAGCLARRIGSEHIGTGIDHGHITADHGPLRGHPHGRTGTTVYPLRTPLPQPTTQSQHGDLR